MSQSEGPTPIEHPDRTNWLSPIKLVPEWLLIAACSTFGFSMAYLYQAGYCTYFKVPVEFIAITPAMTIQGVLAFLTSVAYLALFIYCIAVAVQAFTPWWAAIAA